MLTQVERLIYADGREAGEKRMGELNNRLLQENRTDDALRMSTDVAYRQKLYEEYNIS